MMCRIKNVLSPAKTVLLVYIRLVKVRREIGLQNWKIVRMVICAGISCFCIIPKWDGVCIQVKE